MYNQQTNKQKGKANSRLITSFKVAIVTFKDLQKLVSQQQRENTRCRNSPRFFGFDSGGYSNNKKIRRKNWYEELREQRARDIETEIL
ncbi:MAG: hypothetical protein M3247_08175 [Thermoproteota archaeon]|nr:hypothetical protein [Thermoproteota archaeon]